MKSWCPFCMLNTLTTPNGYCIICLKQKRPNIFRL